MRSALRRLGDERYLLMLTHAAFGAHHPADRLKRALDWRPPLDWRTGVEQAVAHANAREQAEPKPAIARAH